jgi:hypothetical protein
VLADTLAIDWWERNLAPEKIALLDVAGVLLGRAAPAFPGGRAGTADYSARLIELLASPEGPGGSLKPRFLERFVAGPLNDGFELHSDAIAFLKALPSDRVLADFVARKDIFDNLLGYLRELGDEFWRPLVDIRKDLKPALANSKLLDAIEDTAANSAEELKRRPITEGISGTKLALAMYGACESGMTPLQVFKIMSAGARLASALTEAQIYEVMWEFYTMLAFGPDRIPVQVLFGCWEEISLDILGPNHGGRFRAYVIKRLKEDARSRRERLRYLVWLDSRLPWRRRRAAAERARARDALAAVRVPSATHAAELRGLEGVG